MSTARFTPLFNKTTTPNCHAGTTSAAVLPPEVFPPCSSTNGPASHSCLRRRNQPRSYGSVQPRPPLLSTHPKYVAMSWAVDFTRDEPYQPRNCEGSGWTSPPKQQ